MKREQKPAPPESTRDCATCGKARMFMFTIDTKDGPRTYCSGCWKEGA